jgi:HEAT repeat protein
MAHPLPTHGVVACSLFALVLGALVGVARAQEDPVVDGKKGSEWVDILNGKKGESARQKALAVNALMKLWVEKQYIHSLPTIGRALQADGSAAVRIQAAQALGSLRESEVDKEGRGAQDLIDAMGSEKDSKVRMHIAKAIARYRLLPKQAVTQLRRALDDPEAATRAAVAEALAQAGKEGKPAVPELAPLLKDEDKAVRKAAVIALGRVAPEGASAVAETMVKMLAAKNKDGKPEHDLDLRIELLTSIQLLGEKTPAVIAGLAGALTDEEDEIRRRATRTLGLFGTAAAPAADALLKVASSDKVKDISVDAVYAFASAVGPETLKARLKDVLALLSDPDFRVRIAVINDVASLGNELKDDTETLKILRDRLRDPHIKVRETAREAIDRIMKKPEPKKDPDPKKGM